MLPDAASLAVPIVLREKGISGPLPCPATPAPSCRLAHQWLDGCWTPRLKVDLGACVAPSHPPSVSKALLPLDERTNQPTNQAHGNGTKQRTTTAANLGSPPETETLRSATHHSFNFSHFRSSPRSIWRPCTLPQLRVLGSRQFSLLTTTLALLLLLQSGKD